MTPGPQHTGDVAADAHRLSGEGELIVASYFKLHADLRGYVRLGLQQLPQRSPSKPLRPPDMIAHDEHHEIPKAPQIIPMDCTRIVGAPGAEMNR